MLARLYRDNRDLVLVGSLLGILMILFAIGLGMFAWRLYRSA